MPVHYVTDACIAIPSTTRRRCVSPPSHRRLHASYSLNCFLGLLISRRPNVWARARARSVSECRSRRSINVYTIFFFFRFVYLSLVVIVCVFPQSYLNIEFEEKMLFSFGLTTIDDDDQHRVRANNIPHSPAKAHFNSVFLFFFSRIGPRVRRWRPS